MKIKKRRGIVASGAGSEDTEAISYCPCCKKNGFENLLGPRIYLPGEAYREGDEENFRQCQVCGKIVDIWQIKRESTIKDPVDIGDNPFNYGKNIVGFDNRRKRTPIEKRRQRLREEIESAPEEDMKEALLRGGTVEIHFDDTDQLRNQSQ